MSTIKDIEKMTGLSKGTISKFVNGGKVRPENRRLIEEAIKALDYHPNENARIVRGGLRKSVAIVIPNVSVDYCRRIFLTCQQLLVSRGYGATLFNYLDDPGNENRAVNKALDNNFSAIIAMPCDPNAECYQRARSQSVELLFIEKKYIPGAHNIILKDDGAILEVLARLREYGHTRIGSILCRTDNSILLSDRNKNSMCLFERCGIPPQCDDLRYVSSEEPLDVGYRGVEHLLSLNEPPTVIACLNGVTTLGAKIALLEKGLRIPEDISLIGMLSSFSADSPALCNITCVCHPIVDVAEKAVDMMLRVIESKNSKDKGGASEEYISVEFSASVRWAGSIRALNKD